MPVPRAFQQLTSEFQALAFVPAIETRMRLGPTCVMAMGAFDPEIMWIRSKILAALLELPA
jgi:hypothetical protein